MEDDRHGSVNQRSQWCHVTVSLLFLLLSSIGIYGVIINHLGLFLTWLLLRPVVYILDLENPIWNSIAFGLLISGFTTCLATYSTAAKFTELLVM